MDLGKLKKSFEEWCTEADSNSETSNKKEIQSQIDQIEFLLNKIKIQSDPEVIRLNSEIKRKSENVKAAEQRLERLKLSDKTQSGEEFIKESYNKFLIQRTKTELSNSQKMSTLEKQYKYCQTEAKEQYSMFGKLSEKDPSLQISDKDYEELREKSAAASVSGLIKIARENCPDLSQYAENCIKICWLMICQNPPLRLEFEKTNKSEESEDSNIFHVLDKNGNRDTQNKGTPNVTEANRDYELVYPALLRGKRVIKHGIIQERGVSDRL